MDDQTAVDDNTSVMSGSMGGRSPPCLSPVMSMPTTGSPSSPLALPMLTTVPMMPTTNMSGRSPPGYHSPQRPSSQVMYPSSPPITRPPPFLPALYFSHPYNTSPPQIQTSDPTANDCKLIDLRGQKVAAFVINTDSMLCLPQAFELFLKNLVGGLHTVYTKLKRLGIEPLVCNVEQVRVLRGLGAIQPGVNRCKLLSVKHFEILYKDCTTARRDRLSSLLHDRYESHTRPRNGPGRPVKRPHDIMGLGIPAHLHHGAGTAMTHHPLSPEALMALKKSRLDSRDFSPFINGGSGHHAIETDPEKSPLLSNGYNPPPKALMAQYMALNGNLPHPALFAHSGLPLAPHPTSAWTHHQEHPFKSVHLPQDSIRSVMWENCRASYDEFIKNLERIRDERNRCERDIAAVSSREDHRQRSPTPHRTNGYTDPDVLNLSKSESRDDLSDSGANALNTSESSREQHEVDKEDPLSDNEDFEEKNDMSDREDYDYLARSPHVLLSDPANNNSLSINKNSVADSVNSLGKNMMDNIHIQSAANPSTATSNILINSDCTMQQGLNINRSLMGLGMNMMAVTSSMHETASSSDCAEVSRMVESPPTVTPPPLELSSHQSMCSLEKLLANIQNLLKVAAESVRHEEKQWRREKEQLHLEFQRQKDIRERLEKQLVEDEKLKDFYIKKLRREKKARKRLEDQLTDKSKMIPQYDTTSSELMCLRAESVKSAVAAAAAVANAVSTSNMSSSVLTSSLCHSSRSFGIPMHESSHQTSPIAHVEVDSMANKHPNETQPIFFSKPMLFNCSV